MIEITSDAVIPTLDLCFDELLFIEEPGLEYVGGGAITNTL